MAHQLTLALARAKERRKKGRLSQGDGRLQGRVLAALPYKPTGAQTRAIGEIAADMASPQRMNRLLQGDVGAGKTLVAFMALLAAVESGGQGVLMAPTEILARQHLEGLQPLAERAGVVLEILTGRDKGAERRPSWPHLRRVPYQILVGTHAVFQADVSLPICGWRLSMNSTGLACVNGWSWGKRAAGRCSGDDGHAHPAVAGAGAIWRYGRVGAG